MAATRVRSRGTTPAQQQQQDCFAADGGLPPTPSSSSPTFLGGLGREFAHDGFVKTRGGVPFLLGTSRTWGYELHKHAITFCSLDRCVGQAARPHIEF